MEVVIPVHEKMGNFGECFSAPTSPTRLDDFYREFNDFLIRDSIKTGGGGCSPAVPFDWEVKPGVPKLGGASNAPEQDHEEDSSADFAFDVSQELDTLSVSAEELFDGGVIKPLKPPPRLQQQFPAENSPLASAAPSPTRSSSPRSTNVNARGLFSPKKRTKEFDFDPFAASVIKNTHEKERQRGREMARSPSNSSGTRGHHTRTRSLSPFRVSKYPWEEEKAAQLLQPNTKQENSTTDTNKTTTLSTALTTTSSKGLMKWTLRDFFLFRSASEGRSTYRDPLKKYAALFRKHREFGNSSSDSSGSGSGSRRRGRVSAHELHYTVNRAVSEDLKKKTFLPYKQGILGRLAFNPTVNSPANGFGYPNNR